MYYQWIRLFWVIHGERHLGFLWWPYFMVLGFILAIGSLFISSYWGSALMRIFGGSLIWGSTEFKDQAVRAELGWYPSQSNKIRSPFADIIRNGKLHISKWFGGEISYPWLRKRLEVKFPMLSKWKIR